MPRPLTYARILIGMAFLLALLAAFAVPAALRGEHRLLALDAASGRVVWSALVPATEEGHCIEQLIAARDTVLTLSRCGYPSSETSATLTALDAETGRVRWEWQPGSERPDLLGRRDAPPVVAGDNAVYAFLLPNYRDEYSPRTPEEEPGFLVSIDSATGRERWSVPVMEPSLARVRFRSSDPDDDNSRSILAVSADSVALVHFTSVEEGAAVVRVFDEPSGALRWHKRVPPPTSGNWDNFPWQPLASPQFAAIHGGQLLVCYSDRAIAYDLADGTQRWGVLTDNWIDEAFASDGRLFLTTGELSQLITVALDAATGAEQWRRTIIYHTAFSGDGNALYVTRFWGGPEYEENVIAVDPVTGRERWRQKHDYASFSTAVDGDLVVSTPGGDAAQVSRMAAADGAVRWQFSLGRRPAGLVARGRYVYVTDHAPRWRNWLWQLTTGWRS